MFMQLSWCAVHTPASWLVHGFCKQKRSLSKVGGRVQVENYYIGKCIVCVTCFKALLHVCLGGQHHQCLQSEHAVTFLLLSNWRGGSVAILCVREKWGGDVMNLIMMNSWEATHVADHGVIDSELLKLHVWGGVVWLPTILQTQCISESSLSFQWENREHEEENFLWGPCSGCH